ncbi:MAG TPA: hypothetical protein PKN64_07835, partial [Casimicrobium sp.]|nr:hypothetical protein [Casimicrobium sp.]
MLKSKFVFLFDGMRAMRECGRVCAKRAHYGVLVSQRQAKRTRDARDGKVPTDFLPESPYSLYALTAEPWHFQATFSHTRLFEESSASGRLAVVVQEKLLELKRKDFRQTPHLHTI